MSGHTFLRDKTLVKGHQENIFKNLIKGHQEGRTPFSPANKVTLSSETMFEEGWSEDDWVEVGWSEDDLYNPYALPQQP